MCEEMVDSTDVTVYLAPSPSIDLHQRSALRINPLTSNDVASILTPTGTGSVLLYQILNMK
jgi:hypothetical protein